MTWSTAEAAEQVGVSKQTLLRWLADERLPEVARDWRNWRVWSAADIDRARGVREAIHGSPAGVPAPPSTSEAAEAPHKPVGQREYAEDVARLDDARAFRLKREAADAGGQRRNYG